MRLTPDQRELLEVLAEAEASREYRPEVLCAPDIVALVRRDGTYVPTTLDGRDLAAMLTGGCVAPAGEELFRLTEVGRVSLAGRPAQRR
jgi:hypothetical protein